MTMKNLTTKIRAALDTLHLEFEYRCGKPQRYWDRFNRRQTKSAR